MDKPIANLPFSDGFSLERSRRRWTSAVPNFFLYGEAPRQVREKFLHVEDLEERSRASGWNIRPHSHNNLHHAFLVETGGGEMQTEQGIIAYKAPAAVLVPACFVHGFAWQPESRGWVVTVADSYLRDICTRETQFSKLFHAPRALPVAQDAMQDIFPMIVRLNRELSWNSVAHDTAIEAYFVALLVGVLRQVHREDESANFQPGPFAELVARYRSLIEENFRSDVPLSYYARGLGVSESRLRNACLKISGQTPLKLVRNRLLMEARRMLLYTSMSVSEVAYALGIDDPAYFSRLFQKHVGRSPRSFRMSLDQQPQTRKKSRGKALPSPPDGLISR